MKTLEEIRAPYLDEDGNLDVSNLNAVNEDIAQALKQTPSSYQPNGAEYLELTEAHFGQMVQFLLAQMADLMGYVTEIHRTVEQALAGETTVETPQEAAQQFLSDTQPFAVYDRLARLYQLVYDKQRQKLVTP